MEIERRFLDDTHPEVRRRQIARWRSMEPWEKARLLTEACRGLHELQMAGLRRRFPEADEEELRLRAVVARLGIGVARRFLGSRVDAL